MFGNKLCLKLHAQGLATWCVCVCVCLTDFATHTNSSR